MIIKDLISVIMSVYNEKEEWLKESIESILNQNYEFFEFIIVLDNPQNLELKKILEKYKQKDKRIKIIFNDKNLGLIKSLNKALNNCSGEFIARMDADDISHKTRFEMQLNYLKHNNLDLIGCNVNLFKNNKEIFFTTDKLVSHKYLMMLLQYGTIGIVHPTFFGRYNVFKKLDGYKNALHAEDMEFMARVIFNGFKVGNISEILLDCRYSDNSVTKTNAYLMYKTAEYSRKVFKESIKTGRYYFDENYQYLLDTNQKEKNNFNKKQILMAEAREELKNRNYINFLFKVSKSFFYSSSTFTSIKINLIFRVLRFFELLELKRKIK